MDVEGMPDTFKRPTIRAHELSRRLRTNPVVPPEILVVFRTPPLYSESDIFSESTLRYARRN